MFDDPSSSSRIEHGDANPSSTTQNTSRALSLPPIVHHMSARSPDDDKDDDDDEDDTVDEEIKVWSCPALAERSPHLLEISHKSLGPFRNCSQQQQEGKEGGGCSSPWFSNFGSSANLRLSRCAKQNVAQAMLQHDGQQPPQRWCLLVADYDTPHDDHHSLLNVSFPPLSQRKPFLAQQHCPCPDTTRRRKSNSTTGFSPGSSSQSTEPHSDANLLTVDSMVGRGTTKIGPLPNRRRCSDHGRPTGRAFKGSEIGLISFEDFTRDDAFAHHHPSSISSDSQPGFKCQASAATTADLGPVDIEPQSSWSCASSEGREGRRQSRVFRSGSNQTGRSAWKFSFSWQESISREGCGLSCFRV